MEAHGTPAAGTLKGRTANSLLKMGTPQIVSHPAAAAPFAFLARLSRATCTRDRGGRLRHSLPQPLHAEPAGDVTGQTWTGAPSFTPPSVHSGGLRSSHIYTCSWETLGGTWRELRTRPLWMSCRRTEKGAACGRQNPSRRAPGVLTGTGVLAGAEARKTPWVGIQRRLCQRLTSAGRMGTGTGTGAEGTPCWAYWSRPWPVPTTWAHRRWTKSSTASALGGGYAAPAERTRPCVPTDADSQVRFASGIKPGCCASAARAGRPTSSTSRRLRTSSRP
jgi:hypothetical protein